MTDKEYAQKQIKQGAYILKNNGDSNQLIEGIHLLENRQNLDTYDLITIAIGYEKLEEYDLAVKILTYCIDTLTDSPIRNGLQGIMYRNLMKKNKHNKYFEEYKKKAIKAFYMALTLETSETLKEIWDFSSIEIERI